MPGKEKYFLFLFSCENSKWAHLCLPLQWKICSSFIFFSFSTDDVRQALQYLLCDLIKSMTTKNISLLAMTSSVVYTWAGLICIGNYCETPLIQTEAIYWETTAFLPNAAHTIQP